MVPQEDKKLAAALVAVQFQQHQKQQQLQNQLQHEDPSLSDVSHLTTLSPVNAYTIQSMQEPEQPAVYPILQFKRSQGVKQEFINVKSEYDIDVSADSSEDATAPNSGPKRSLPHKKRIPRKLKQQTKKSSSKRDAGKISEEFLSLENVQNEIQGFRCELCGNRFEGQLKFFEHLKVKIFCAVHGSPAPQFSTHRFFKINSSFLFS